MHARYRPWPETAYARDRQCRVLLQGTPFSRAAQDCEKEVKAEVVCRKSTARAAGTGTKRSAVHALFFPFHKLLSAIPHFLYSRTSHSLLSCLCVGVTPK